MSDTPLVRYLDVLEPRRPFTVVPPLRILGMVARPDDLDSLNIDHEQRRLREALAGLERSGRVQLHWVVGQTWWDLQAALDQEHWHILHFIGHGGFDPGSGEGLLALAGEDGRTHRLGVNDLALLLAEHRSLRLAVLNSCDSARGSAADVFSSTAAVLMRRGIPAVVAMQYEISDEAAITFARGFYTAIAAQHPVEQAVTRARRAVKLARRNTLEWATPVLYLRSPTGAIFNLADVAPEPTQTTQPVTDTQAEAHTETQSEASAETEEQAELDKHHLTSSDVDSSSHTLQKGISVPAVDPTVLDGHTVADRVGSVITTPQFRRWTPILARRNRGTLAATIAVLVIAAIALLTMLTPATRNQSTVRILTGHTGPVNAVAFAADGKTLATAIVKTLGQSLYIQGRGINCHWFVLPFPIIG